MDTCLFPSVCDFLLSHLSELSPIELLFLISMEVDVTKVLSEFRVAKVNGQLSVYTSFGPSVEFHRTDHIYVLKILSSLDDRIL